MRSRGFSYIELLIGVALSGLLGAFAYKFLVSNLFMQVSQKDLVQFQGTAASGLDGLRRDLQQIDLSMLKSGFAAITVTKDTNNNDVLTYWVPDFAMASFRTSIGYLLDQGFWPVPSTTPADVGTTPFSLLPLDPYPWTVYCSPINPPISVGPPSEVPLYASSYPNLDQVLLWSPGINILTAISNGTSPCHTNGSGKADGLYDLGYWGNVYPTIVDPPVTRYIPPNTLVGRPIIQRTIQLLYPTAATGQPAWTYGYIYNYTPGVVLNTVSSIPAITLSISFDVNGAETSYSSTLDWAKVSAVNLNIGGIVETRDNYGKKMMKNVPVKMKVNFRNQSSTYVDPKPTDKNLLTPNLVSFNGLGVGQPAIDTSAGNARLYLPLIHWANPTETSTGSVKVYGLPDLTEQAEIDLRNQTDTSTGMPSSYYFIPSKAVIANLGLILGGYLKDTGTRRAAFVLVPRQGGIAGAPIDVTATPRITFMGNEHGVPSGFDPSHFYYFADTMNLAISGNHLYWSSYTRTDDVILTDSHNRATIYRTDLTDHIDTAYTVIQDNYVNSLSNGQADNMLGRIMSGLALNAAGDHLYNCFDFKYDNTQATNNWNGMYGTIQVGDPNSLTLVSDPIVPTDQDWEMTSRNTSNEFFGSCTGMEVHPNGDLYISGRTNFLKQTEGLIEKFRTFNSRNYIAAPPLLAWPDFTSVPSELLVDQDHISQGAGYTSWTLNGIVGFAINPAVTDHAEIYFAHVNQPGGPANATLNRFTHETISTLSSSTLRLVTSTASAMNQTRVTVTNPQPNGIPQVGELFPHNSYNTSSNLLVLPNHSPLNCRKLPVGGAGLDSWENCVKRRLGGLDL